MTNKRGFSSKIYNFCRVFSIICLMATPSYVFAQSSSVKTSAKKAEKAEDDGKLSTKAQKSNKALAQGLSVAESMLLNENPWGFYFTTSISRGLDEYQDSLNSVNSLNLSYRLNEKSALGLSFDYDTVLYSYGGEFLNNPVDDPDRLGFGDVTVSYSLPNVWSDKYNRLVINTALTAPSSKVAQRTGLGADWSTSMALRYKPMVGVIITPSVSGYVRYNRFDSDSRAGRAYNSPWGISYSLAGSYMFTSRIIGSVSYGQTQRHEYGGKTQLIQTAVAQLSWSATDTLNVFGGYRWRDRILTNESLFDDDRVLIYTGVGYAF